MSNKLERKQYQIEEIQCSQRRGEASEQHRKSFLKQEPGVQHLPMLMIITPGKWTKREMKEACAYSFVPFHYRWMGFGILVSKRNPSLLGLYFVSANRKSAKREQIE